MTRRFRIVLEVETPDSWDGERVSTYLKDVASPGVAVQSVLMDDCSPEPGVQAAFIYKNSAHDRCHAVVKKKNGPWSENRFGFCGIEPETGPMGSIDQPEGGLCSTCAKYVRKGDDGLWYVREGAPLPKAKVRASMDCGGCFDDD